MREGAQLGMEGRKAMWLALCMKSSLESSKDMKADFVVSGPQFPPGSRKAGLSAFTVRERFTDQVCVINGLQRGGG